MKENTHYLNNEINIKGGAYFLSKNINRLYKPVNFNKDRWRLIDKHFSYTIPIGYCYCDTHRGYISMNLARTHNCLYKCNGKRCPFLKLNDAHSVIKKVEKERKAREDSKSKAKLNKRIKKLYYSDIINYADYVKYQSYVDKNIPIENILDKLG